MSGFFDPNKVTEGSIAAAEKDLQNAIEAERPDEIGAKLADTPENKTGFVKTPEVPEVVDGVNYKERYQNLQRWIDKKLKPDYDKKLSDMQLQVGTLTSKIENLSRSAAPASLPKDEVELEKLKTENPAAFSALVTLATTIAERIVSDKTASFDQKFNELEDFKKNNEAEAAFNQLQGLNPDIKLNEVLGSIEFETWLGKQSKLFQKCMTDGFDVDGANQVIKMYKVTLAPKKGAKKTNNDAQQVNVPNQPELPSGDPGFDFTESQIDHMDRTQPGWFDKNQEAISKALSTARVLRDMSDPAGTAQRMAARAA